MPSTIEAASERARRIAEERTFPADEPPPYPPDGQRPGEQATESDLRGIAFEEGVSDAWGSGWPMRR